MTFTIEPMINAGKPRDPRAGRRLDHRHQGPQPVGAVGAHGARHRDRLRGADAVGRQSAAAGLRRRQRRLRRADAQLPPRRTTLRAAAERCRAAEAPALIAASATRQPGAAAAAACARSSTQRCCELWHDAGLPAGAALVAVGGYGRGELFPYSDVDVLVLLPQRAADDGRARARSSGSSPLLGHRPGDRLQRAHGRRVHRRGAPATSRCRPRCSKRASSPARAALFDALPARATGEAMDPQAFFRAKTLEMRQRHAKYEDTPYSLEPNCKESPGGLRDLQVICGSRAPPASAAPGRELAAQRPDHARRGAPAAAQRGACSRIRAPPALRSPAGARTAWCSTCRPPSPSSFGYQPTRAARAAPAKR